MDIIQRWQKTRALFRILPSLIVSDVGLIYDAGYLENGDSYKYYVDYDTFDIVHPK